MWADNTPGKADKHVANTNPVIRDMEGFPGGSVVTSWHFRCSGPGSISGGGT